MLKKELQKIIPLELNEFSKLNNTDTPYYFECWDRDKRWNELILRYWFWNRAGNKKNYKRLFINELDALIKISLENGYLLRSDFNRICIRTYGDGPCGFTVIVAILEHLKVIQKMEPGKYSIINIRKIRDLLN